MSKDHVPDQNDHLFVSSEDWWANACLNWHPNGWSLYADGYKKSADALITEALKHQHYQDWSVYPIVFLYRQYLELILKDLIRQSSSLQDLANHTPKLGHNLLKLWAKFHDLISEVSPDDSTEELKQISRLIEEFSCADPLSTAFRYPEDKDGNPSLPDMARIDIRNLQITMEKIHTLLDGAREQIAVYLSYKSEMLEAHLGDLSSEL